MNKQIRRRIAVGAVALGASLGVGASVAAASQPTQAFGVQNSNGQWHVHSNNGNWERPVVRQITSNSGSWKVPAVRSTTFFYGRYGVAVVRQVTSNNGNWHVPVESLTSNHNNGSLQVTPKACVILLSSSNTGSRNAPVRPTCTQSNQTTLV
jgi:hypothetical protein